MSFRVCVLLFVMAVVCAGYARGPVRELRGEVPTINASHELTVPDNLWSAIVKRFPGFRLAAARDYRVGGPNSEAYYIYSFSDTTLPFVSSGDFNGDGWWDVVTYLIPEPSPSRDSVKAAIRALMQA